MNLGEVFDPRRNALNAFRLALATGVIVWHSFPLTGRDVTFAPAHQLLGQIFVDGFFAISGFLITASWLNDPRLRYYFTARGLRILPGLWVCLIVTAFVVAPVAVLIQGGSPGRMLRSWQPVEYILGNAAVVTLKVDIGGTPSGIPHPGIWNGSLWTITWEVLCYILIAVFGTVGLLRRRWFIPMAFALVLLWSVLQQQSTIYAASWTVPVMAARFALMFLAGALLYQFRDAIPARWSLVALSVAVVLASSLLPNYHIVAAVPLAYAIIASGSLIHNKRLRLRTDVSYGVYIYAFPIQQLLVIVGLATLNSVVFAVIATAAVLPIATLSWILVEKPSLSLKSRLKRRSVVHPSEDVVGTGLDDVVAPPPAGSENPEYSAHEPCEPTARDPLPKTL